MKIFKPPSALINAGLMTITLIIITSAWLKASPHITVVQPSHTEITEIAVQKSFGLAAILSENPAILRPDKEDLYANASFYQLAEWLQRKNFFDMKETYGGPEPHDCGGTSISVARGVQRKTVSNYCGSGGFELWEMEMVIRGVAADIAKRKEEKKQIEAHIEENKRRGLIK